MNVDADFRRPDPGAGLPGDAAYARAWADGHRNVADPLAYRLGYADVLVLDGILPDGYSLLDVGCGTGGYHRFLKRHGSVVGIDFQPEMIDEARVLATELGTARAEYVCARFEDYMHERPFDAVRMLGVYGWYRPWKGNENVLRRVRDLLAPGGVAVLSHVPPRGLLDRAKALLAPSRTVVLGADRFTAMLEASAFSPISAIDTGHARVVVARRVDR